MWGEGGGALAAGDGELGGTSPGGPRRVLQAAVLGPKASAHPLLPGVRGAHTPRPELPGTRWPAPRPHTRPERTQGHARSHTPPPRGASYLQRRAGRAGLREQRRAGPGAGARRAGRAAASGCGRGPGGLALGLRLRPPPRPASAPLGTGAWSPRGRGALPAAHADWRRAVGRTRCGGGGRDPEGKGAGVRAARLGLTPRARSGPPRAALPRSGCGERPRSLPAPGPAGRWPRGPRPPRGGVQAAELRARTGPGWERKPRGGGRPLRVRLRSVPRLGRRGRPAPGGAQRDGLMGELVPGSVL